jgi:hypothetical protein
MKTVQEMKTLIKQLDEAMLGKEPPMTRRKAGRLRRFYYKVQLYLETEPREAFLLSMKADKERHIRHITDAITAKLLNDLYPKLTPRKARSQFLKDNGVPAMKDMIKTINFILN